MNANSRFVPVLHAGAYVIPMLFCLAVHSLALRMWFLGDDFAWLGLPLHVHSWRDLWYVLFTPMAQGTVRTLSERLYFLVFTWIFGLHALPFHIWVFATQFANLALLVRTTARITGSLVAGFAAAMVWAANSGLALVMSWASAYNEIACSFFILLAFYLFVRYAQTGRARYWAGTWAAFVLGFGALELNAVFPALACGYALLRARAYFKKSLLLFIPSAVFTLLHYLFIPIEGRQFYGMHFDSDVFRTFAKYWAQATAAYRSDSFGVVPHQALAATAIAITLALAIFTVRRARRGDWLPVFFLGWFVVVIVPVVPLKNHFTEYYVTIPSIGLAMLGGYALSRVSRVMVGVAAAVLVCCYLVFSIRDIRMVDRFNVPRSKYIRAVVTSLQKTRARDDSKAILIDGLTNEAFEAGFYDDPFRLIGIKQIYVTPGTRVTMHPEWGDVASRFTVTPFAALAALRQNAAVVYQYTPLGLRDITAQYTRAAAVKFAGAKPDYIDAGNPAFARLLGPTWWGIDGGYRWMPKTATIELAGPVRAGEKLYMAGFCPKEVLAAGPLTVTVTASGQEIGEAALKEGGNFELAFPMPDDLVGKPSVLISIETSRTVSPNGEARALSLLFGTFTIK